MTSEAFILRLPAEIIIEIVEIAILIPPQEVRYVAFDSDYRRDSILLLCLSHVCHSWRVLITETSSLWSFASTLYGSGLTQHIVELSRESLLTVELMVNSVTVTDLYKQQARIKALKISHYLHQGNRDRNIVAGLFLEPPAPSLQDISIIWTPANQLTLSDSMPLFSGDHPRLRSVYLSRVAPPWQSSVFRGLTRLVVRQVPPASKGLESQQLTSILNSCPGLVDLELSDAGPVDKVPGRRVRMSLQCLLSLTLYMPQETCKDFLSLLDLPKLVRLSIGHDEKCREDIEHLIPPHIRPSQASQSAEITIHPSLNYSRIIFRAGTSDQHPESFRFHYYSKRGDDFGAKSSFVTSALRAWDEGHTLPMTLKVTLSPFRSVDMPTALGRVLAMFSNIVRIVFTTVARSGYEDDAYDALYVLEETVKHGQLAAPNVAELTFRSMRFDGRLDALRHILLFRSQNGAILPHLTFRTCTGIQRSELCLLLNEKIIREFTLI